MSTTASDRKVQDMVYVGVGRRVIALDRYTGEILWDWKCPKTASYVSLVVDGDRLIVGVNGYIYCLEPLYGDLVWENPLKGKGVGITCISTGNGSTTGHHLLAGAAAAASQSRSSGAAT